MLDRTWKRVGDGREIEVGGQENGKRKGEARKVSTLMDSM